MYAISNITPFVSCNFLLFHSALSNIRRSWGEHVGACWIGVCGFFFPGAHSFSWTCCLKTVLQRALFYKTTFWHSTNSLILSTKGLSTKYLWSIMYMYYEVTLFRKILSVQIIRMFFMCGERKCNVWTSCVIAIWI